MDAALDARFALAAAVADRCRARLLAGFADPGLVSRKADGSVVTAVEVDCERLVRASIRAAVPADGVIGEELPATDPDAETCWLVDPVDGTTACVCGLPSFAFMLAIRHRGRFVFGLIDQPVLGVRWQGGATAAGRVASRLATTRALSEARMSTSGPVGYAAGRWAEMLPLQRAAAVVVYGAEALDFGALVDGRIDLIVDCGLEAHDLAAPTAFLRAAGVSVTDWSGRDPEDSDDGTFVAACTPALHRAALEALRD